MPTKMQKQFISVCIFLMLQCAVAFCQMPIKMTSHKIQILQYEPIFLTFSIEEKYQKDGFVFGMLEDDGLGYALIIYPPSGNMFVYAPPVRMEVRTPAIERERLQHATIIYQKGHIITGAAGEYRMVLRTTTCCTVSNELIIQVISANSSEDIAAQKIIEKNVNSYAYFVYMGGGDFIIDGFAISREVAKTESQYAPLARAVLAMNFSQTFYLPPFYNEIRRKDLDSAEGYFQALNTSIVPVSLNVKVANLLASRFIFSSFKPQTRAKIALIKDNAAGTIDSLSYQFKSLRNLIN